MMHGDAELQCDKDMQPCPAASYCSRRPLHKVRALHAGSANSSTGTHSQGCVNIIVKTRKTLPSVEVGGSNPTWARARLWSRRVRHVMFSGGMPPDVFSSTRLKHPKMFSRHPVQLLALTFMMSAVVLAGMCRAGRAGAPQPESPQHCRPQGCERSLEDERTLGPLSYWGTLLVHLGRR